MTPDEYCADKAAKSGSSFYAAFRFLPAPRRRAMCALYAFCREVDDAVDECTDENIARTKLAWWRTELAGAFAGNPQHPVTKALMPVAVSYGLPESEFSEIIDGMAMDLTQSRYTDFEALAVYCHRVAGVVGQLSARIFGMTDPQTLVYAHELGMAFQLTNIIRDVREDARRGRIYLPVAELQQFEVPAADIMAYKITPQFDALMRFQINRAESYYQKALAALPKVDRKAQRPGLVMAAIYHTVLLEIRDDGAGNVLKHRISLGPLFKVWLAWRTWWLGMPKHV